MGKNLLLKKQILSYKSRPIFEGQTVSHKSCVPLKLGVPIHVYPVSSIKGDFIIFITDIKETTKLYFHQPNMGYSLTSNKSY